MYINIKNISQLGISKLINIPRSFLLMLFCSKISNKNLLGSIVGICFVVLLVSCTTPQPRKPIVQRTSTFLQESIERNKIVNKVEEVAFGELMKTDTTNNYFTSESGFWYYYNIKNTADSKLPETGDEVIFTFEIKDINNETIYSKEELGEKNYLVDKQELITGLQDGIKLMKEGETVTFLFPSHKAYGYAGYQKIKSNEPLIYIVTLHKIDSTNK